MASTYTIGISVGLNFKATTSAYTDPITLAVSANYNLATAITYQAIRVYTLDVAATVEFEVGLTYERLTTYTLNVSTALGLQPAAIEQAIRIYSVNVSTGLGLSAALATSITTTYTVNVSTDMELSAQLSALRNAVHTGNVSTNLNVNAAVAILRTVNLHVSAGLGLSAALATEAERLLSVSTGLGLSAAVLSGRDIVLYVSSGLGIQPQSQPVSSFYVVDVSSRLTMSVIVSASIAGLGVESTLALECFVWAEVIVAGAVEGDGNAGIPGLSPTGGPQNTLYTGISGSYPFTFAETPSGIVLMANGVDPMLMWDSLSNATDVAGVQPPQAPITITDSGSPPIIDPDATIADPPPQLGTLTGIRYVMHRWLDQYGNTSTLGPLSTPVNCGYDCNLDSIAVNSSGVVTITARGHGLVTNQWIIIDGVGGMALNGAVSVTVIDDSDFTLNNIVGSGSWTGGGTFVAGSASLAYALNSGDTPPVKATRVQVLRNLEGNGDTFYVDVDTINAPGEALATLLASGFTSSLTDEQLAANEPVVIRTQDGWPLALRDAAPPSNRPYLVNYMGRIFAAGDAIYWAGCVATQTGSNQIQGIGTQWPATFAGRNIYVKGSSQPYSILSVNTSEQTLTISMLFADLSQPYVTYLIRSAPSERKMIQWSEPDKPQSWPPWNAVGIPEDNDEIVGLCVKGTFLYIVERRHIWRYQFNDDPALGHVYLSIDSRGAINQRLIVQADDTVFLLDESGIYAFDGGNSTEPISEPIQSVFQTDGLTYTYQIDWSADTTLWHASLDPVKTIIRWFVTMVGQPALTTAIAYNYRLKRWWLESYPVAISSSATGTLAEAPNVGIPGGYRRPIVGAEARMLLVLGEGALDLVVDGGTLRGCVTSATSTTLTDSSAKFASYLGGAPISIVSGTGAGQSAIISANTSTTITVVQPWVTIPNTTSVYQIGGVSFEWRSGWLDIEDEEGDTTRDYVITYEPLTSSTQVSTQFFYDHSPNPELWAYPKSQDGVYVYQGQPDVWCDLTASDVLPGYRVWRQAQHSERYAYADRFVQILISGVQNDQVVRIYQVSIRGVDQEGI